MVASSSTVHIVASAILLLTRQAAAQGCNSAGEIYVSSFNQFCGAALPSTGDDVYLRKQTKCWICEDIVKGYMKNGMQYLPPSGTDFSPDTRTSHTMGGDFFVFGYDAEGIYQGDPAWNDATIGGWPPAYTCTCMNGYEEDLTSCQTECAGTYAIPEATCIDTCGDTAGCGDTACRKGYQYHDHGATSGGTTYYSEKVEHQYELSAMAGSNGAFFHGYFYDTFNSGGETVFTAATPNGGFMSCAFNDYPWETDIDPASEMLAQAATAAADALYVSSFNQFCDGGLPTGAGTIHLRQQTKCWICEDTVKGYINSLKAGTPYLPPCGTNFAVDPDALPFQLCGDFFVFGFDKAGLQQAMPEWNSLSLPALAFQAGGGWPPSNPDGDCSCLNSINESMEECKASCGGDFPGAHAAVGVVGPETDWATGILPQTCMELCGNAYGCDLECGVVDGDGNSVPCGNRNSCRAHVDSQDASTEGNGGFGTYYYSEKVEHQYELTAIATKGAFFHGYYLDSIDIPGETMFTHPDGAGGWVSCSFSDYPWENHDGDTTTIIGMLEAMADPTAGR